MSTNGTGVRTSQRQAHSSRGRPERNGRNRTPRIYLRCYGCDKTTESLPWHPGTMCVEPECLHNRWPKNDHETLVTYLPEWPHHRKLQFSALPSMMEVARRRIDIFARWGDSDQDYPSSCRSQEKEKLRAWKYADIQPYLPYKRDFLGEHGWRCGSPLCYRSKRLQTWITHPNVFVLDLATYDWSRTLKDPRTWAIVNVAIESNLRHLAAWTAGNAGLSLAMLVRAANQFISADKRLRAYALYDQYDKSVQNTVLTTLRSWGCVAIPVPSADSKTVYTPEQIRDKVCDRAVALVGDWKPEQYWEVTDGWDAVGMIMYRLLFAQVIRDLRPTHIVAPLGTGNLIMGCLLAVEDWENAKPENKGTVVTIGAEPAGKLNITSQISRRRQIVVEDEERNGVQAPLMPKIASTYSALLACVESALEKVRLRSMRADATDQLQAGHELATPARGRAIRAEPSSLSAFAVLPRLRRELPEGRKEQQNQRMLVVNSGYGLLSEEEQLFMSQFGR